MEPVLSSIVCPNTFFVEDEEKTTTPATCHHHARCCVMQSPTQRLPKTHCALAPRSSAACVNWSVSATLVNWVPGAHCSDISVTGSLTCCLSYDVPDFCSRPRCSPRTWVSSLLVADPRAPCYSFSPVCSLRQLASSFPKTLLPEELGLPAT